MFHLLPLFCKEILFDFHLYLRFVYSLSFIYFSIIYICMDSEIYFILQALIPYFVYFVAKLLQLWPVELYLFAFAFLLHTHIMVGCFILAGGLFFEYSLTSWQHKILQAHLEPALESVISSSMDPLMERIIPLGIGTISRL